LIGSGLDSNTKWPDLETMIISDCRNAWDIFLEYSSGVTKSWSPQTINVGMFANVRSAAVSS
jgi:hypothetical protein